MTRFGMILLCSLPLVGHLADITDRADEVGLSR
jgi:hypothetical protein